jgi:hypothetical protein
MVLLASETAPHPASRGETCRAPCRKRRSPPVQRIYARLRFFGQTRTSAGRGSSREACGSGQNRPLPHIDRKAAALPGSSSACANRAATSPVGSGVAAGPRSGRSQCHDLSSREQRKGPPNSNRVGSSMSPREEPKWRSLRPGRPSRRCGPKSGEPAASIRSQVAAVTASCTAVS